MSFGDGLTLNISEADDAHDLDLAREVAKFFRIQAKPANGIIDEVVRVVQQGRKQARQQSLSVSEPDRMAPAFRIADAVN